LLSIYIEVQEHHVQIQYSKKDYGACTQLTLFYSCLLQIKATEIDFWLLHFGPSI